MTKLHIARSISRTILTFLLYSVVGFSVAHVLSNNAHERSLIRKELLRDYDKAILPDNVTVKFSFSLVRFDPKPELDRLDLYGWTRYVWTDTRLVWNASKPAYRGEEDALRVPSDSIWKPDIILHNSYGIDKPCSPSNALIYPTGQVIWVPRCTFEVICDMKYLRENPNGRQNCYLRFESWTYHGYMMGLEHYSNTSNMNLDDHVGGTFNWKITKNVGDRDEHYYTCCPEPYTSISFQIEFERNKNRMGRNWSPRPVQLSTILFTLTWISILMSINVF